MSGGNVKRLWLVWGGTPNHWTGDSDDDAYSAWQFDENPVDFRLVRSKLFGKLDREWERKARLFDENPDGDRLWVVWNVYSDGDSFGQSTGVVDAWWVGDTEDAAREQYKRAKAHDYGYFASEPETHCACMTVEERL